MKNSTAITLLFMMSAIFVLPRSTIAQQLKIIDLETRALAKADARWFGRATMEQTADGTIVLCYREAARHTGSDGVIHVRFSSDGGQSWSRVFTAAHRVEWSLQCRRSDGESGGAG